MHANHLHIKSCQSSKQLVPLLLTTSGLHLNQSLRLCQFVNCFSCSNIEQACLIPSGPIYVTLVMANEWGGVFFWSMMRSSSSPGFNPSILRHSGSWGAADDAVLNKVHEKKKKNRIQPTTVCCNSHHRGEWEGINWEGGGEGDPW